MKRSTLVRWLIAAFAIMVGPLSAAEKVSVAAAANLVYAIEAINAEFRKAEPAIELVASIGASGNLFAQIKNGAPIDVFLSADLDYPQQLVKEGAADAASLTTFATGRLVLWTTKPEIDITDLSEAVRNPAVHKIALANPSAAPYGRAAKQVLEKIGAWKEVSSKFVSGENITQTAQFVETGNADLGFVALSLVLSPKLKEKGRYTEVPSELYSRLDHGAVLTKTGSENAAARKYLAFLRGPAAKAVLERFGYGVP